MEEKNDSVSCGCGCFAISFSSIAAFALSLVVNGDIGWAIFHGILGWVYIFYYMCTLLLKVLCIV